MNCRIAGALAVSLLLTAMARAEDGGRADVIFRGGEIVTVNDRQPQAEAVAISNGIIQAVGDDATVLKWKGANTKVIDLGGNTLVPGFIDAHGHLFNAGVQALAANLLAAPDGAVQDIGALQATLKAWGEGKTSRKLGWIIGFGYDDAQLTEQRHPTRDELDAVSAEIPVIAIHQSGHLATVNSKVLELAGITASSKDPKGGVIRRRPGSQEPDGVLEETAFFSLLGTLPKLSVSDQEAIAKAGEDLYLSFGFTTAQEGRSTLGINNTWEELAKKDALTIDVVAYPDIVGADRSMASPFVGRTYKQHFRIGGVKLNLDGSPQGKTAWLTKPYFKAPPGQKPDYLGYPTFSDTEAAAYVEKAFANNWQIMAHVNGDAAVDQFIQAVRQAEATHGKTDRRPVAIHAQTARKDQVAAFQELGIIPSFFPMHTYYWGDWHRSSVLGPERGNNISPTGWALEQGMIFTSHHDAPVALPDSMRVLSSTVTRVARGSGEVVGPQHRVPPIVGLKAMTLWAAYQHFEDKTKGSIEPGKVADFVVLSENPIRIDPLRIADIQVLETIKGGRSVYRRNPKTASNTVASNTVGPASSCAASAKCFTMMAPVGASLIGQDLHRH
ncbi:amidohydrolase 3 [Cyanobium sp. PCC 7001]|uniref:amidohydrolase n=1 Tax=Cyanobium sp. PCC 7001 TaxID=180281 RepID=UPI00018057C0|nr:amidohydrolase [Cyanobium sp. PCC 7001]EDY38568.1 amidohydrolase 3 [Cyanobium sp. PCC 7001]